MKFLLLVILLSTLMLNQARAQQPTEKVLKEEQTTKTVKVKKTPLVKSSKLQPTKTVTSKTTAKSASVKLVEKDSPNLKKGTNATQNKTIVSPSTTISPSTSSKTKVHSAVSDKSRTIQYEKTGDPIQDAENYREAKEAYLAKHPELKQTKTTARKISKADYNQLPAARKAVVDANPDKYEIVD